MKDYLGIQSVHALEVLDSRGNPTVQVEEFQMQSKMLIQKLLKK